MGTGKGRKGNKCPETTTVCTAGRSRAAQLMVAPSRRGQAGSKGKAEAQGRPRPGCGMLAASRSTAWPQFTLPLIICC